MILGIEFGSTRIKAVGIDGSFRPILSGDHTWKSSYENGVWTYSMEHAWQGLKEALLPFRGHEIEAAGVSGMMHGYLAFDRDWNLLTPFRTWQNTITAEAAEILSERFSFNIPQRWSIAHLYQAMLRKEDHVPHIAHITTLAGYIHFMLTGVNAVGIGEASGIFPIDSETLDYDRKMMASFDELAKDQPWTLREILPQVLTAGEPAGALTPEGAALLDGLLPIGTPFVPCEGDAGTGMAATCSVAPRTGNVSAGTSIFAMVVLEHKLKRMYPEVDLVTTPTGRSVAMVHCNNCTNDMNAWVELIGETLELFGDRPAVADLFTGLYQKSMEGDPDCGGVVVCNYLSGEGVTHFDKGRPLVLRDADSHFTAANFFRAQLYSTMATLRIGLKILEKEQVRIDRLTGHGGLFKTPLVGQKYLAAACGAPVTCRNTAGEGGPYGMALLAAFGLCKKPGECLEDFLVSKVFLEAEEITIQPDSELAGGFAKYMQRYHKLLQVERTAVVLATEENNAV